jgi:hypothetical protein
MPMENVESGVAFWSSPKYVLFQPMAAEDVATALARIAIGQPVNGIAEIGGPEQFRVDQLVRRRLASLTDSREVIADPNARYDGAKVSEKHCFRAITHDSPRPVSKAGSPSPQHKLRVHVLSPQALQ